MPTISFLLWTGAGGRLSLDWSVAVKAERKGTLPTSSCSYRVPYVPDFEGPGSELKVCTLITRLTALLRLRKGGCQLPRVTEDTAHHPPHRAHGFQALILQLNRTLPKELSKQIEVEGRKEGTPRTESCWRQSRSGARAMSPGSALRSAFACFPVCWLQPQ